MVTDTALHLSLFLTASYISNSVSENKRMKLFTLKSSGAKWTFWDLFHPWLYEPLCPNISHHFHHCFIARVRENLGAKIKSRPSCLLKRSSEAAVRKIDIIDSPKYAFSPPEYVRMKPTVCCTPPRHCWGRNEEHLNICLLYPTPCSLTGRRDTRALDTSTFNSIRGKFSENAVNA